jgi:hypothetical protein
MHYRLVQPQHLSDVHRSFIDQFTRAIALVSTTSSAIVAAKDIQSRHFAASDSYGRIHGLSCGLHAAGLLDSEMPCKGAACFADCYVRSDRRLLDGGAHPGATQTVLNIHRYATGSKALVFDKFLLKHHATRSILGIVLAAYETSIDRFTACFPGYWTQFGFGCTIERVVRPSVDGLGKLSQVEHEVAFLLAVGFDAETLACVLPRLRPGRAADVDAALFGLAEKAARAGVPMACLRDCLIEAHVHQRMPMLFFDKVAGSHT